MSTQGGQPEDEVSEVLRRWPLAREQPDRVRFLTTDRGAKRLQVRVSLGILEMEVVGRPDGEAPGGFGTELDRARSGGVPPRGEVCERLREEIEIYRQRASAFLTLREYARAAIDASHCIEVARFVQIAARQEFAAHGFDALLLAALLMRTQALATGALHLNDSTGALRAVEAGLRDIEACEFGVRGIDRAGYLELELMRSLREALVPKLPSSQRADLVDRLAAALRAENYELAAILRNELRQMGA